MALTLAPNSVYIETYGCQMNALDSELVGNQLCQHGFTLAACIEDASVVLINTCSVRALAEQKVWSQLGRLSIQKRNERPDLVIGVIGCMAEREGQRIGTRMPLVDVVCGPSRLNQLPELIARARQTHQQQIAQSGHANRKATTSTATDGVDALDRTRSFGPAPRHTPAYVRITRGCDKLCSFCVVPYARGPEVHRPPSEIIHEAQQLVAAGALEITLIGQTVNHYRFSENGTTTSFADLLWRVHEAVTSLPRLRFVTSYPRDFGDDVLDAMAAAPRISRYLHLPAQSGANRILRLMNRGYTVEDYVDLIERVRQRLPDVRLAGDMIVGFPTETDDEHQLSLGLVSHARYKNLFVFKYSPRPGTVAARRCVDDVSPEVKKQRNREMLDLQSTISLAHNQAQVGNVLDVLVEGETKIRKSAACSTVHLGWEKNHTRLLARTIYDEIVAFDGPRALLGTIAKIRIHTATNLTLVGDLLPADTGV